MNLSGSANMLLNFSTAVVLLFPLLVAIEPMVFMTKVQLFQKVFKYSVKVPSYRMCNLVRPRSHWKKKRVYQHLTINTM
jgi:hypothetical protein